MSSYFSSLSNPDRTGLNMATAEHGSGSYGAQIMLQCRQAVRQPTSLHVLMSLLLFRRPTYTITCNGGEQQEVPDEALEGLREPKSPMMPDATPPSIAAPSPSDEAPMEEDTPPGRAAPPSPRPPTHSFHAQPNPQAPFAASRPTAVPGALCLLM